jgi:hypothetical protein
MGNVIMKLTPLETEVLENLFDSANGNGHDFGYTEDHGIDPKQARGVISSLVQKRIIMVHEPVTTDSGTWHQFTWVGKEAHEVNSIADICPDASLTAGRPLFRVIPAFIHVPVSGDATYIPVSAIAQLAQREWGVVITMDEKTTDRLSEEPVFDRPAFNKLPEATT